MKQHRESRCLQGKDVLSWKSDSTREFKNSPQNMPFCPPRDSVIKMPFAWEGSDSCLSKRETKMSPFCLGPGYYVKVFSPEIESLLAWARFSISPKNGGHRSYCPPLLWKNKGKCGVLRLEVSLKWFSLFFSWDGVKERFFAKFLSAWSTPTVTSPSGRTLPLWLHTEKAFRFPVSTSWDPPPPQQIEKVSGRKTCTTEN